MAVSSPRALFDAMLPIENDLAAALGFDLEHADLVTRITARSGLGLVAVLAYALLNKTPSAGQPLLTLADLQAAVAVARSNSWPQEPESVPITG
jgi:hypothetical protein